MALKFGFASIKVEQRDIEHKKYFNAELLKRRSQAIVKSVIKRLNDKFGEGIRRSSYPGPKHHVINILNRSIGSYSIGKKMLDKNRYAFGIGHKNYKLSESALLKVIVVKMKPKSHRDVISSSYREYKFAGAYYPMFRVVSPKGIDNLANYDPKLIYEIVGKIIYSQIVQHTIGASSVYNKIAGNLDISVDRYDLIPRSLHKNLEPKLGSDKNIYYFIMRSLAMYYSPSSIKGTLGRYAGDNWIRKISRAYLTRRVIDRMLDPRRYYYMNVIKPERSYFTINEAIRTNRLVKFFIQG